jgi:hypothetical protein
VNTLQDESSWFNLGDFTEKEYKARTASPGPYQPSLMTYFPMNYKIIGSGVFASDSTTMQ